MANQTYKAFVARPSHILDLNGELLDSAPVLSKLASEVQGISSYATPTLSVMTPSLKVSWRVLLLMLLLRLVVRQV